MAPIKLTYKLVGRSIIVVDGKEKLVLTTADEKVRAKIKKELEGYTLRPTPERKAKIIKMMQPKTEAKKKEKVVEKAKKKNAIKEVKRELAAPKKKIKTLLDYFKGEKRLHIVGKDVMMVGVDVPMPKELVDAIELAIENKEGIDHLINFWTLVLLNPNPVAREKIFGYIKRHKLIVTPNGYFVTYRMVKTHLNDSNKTKLPDGVYTDAHTHKMRYKMGQAFTLDRATECDEDGNRDCSRGLHTGTPDFIGLKLGEGYDKGYKWVNKASGGGQGTGYGSEPTQVKQEFDNSFGNQAVMCLVNPMHVVSVPNSDTRKMRSCELYFVKEVTADEVVKLQTSNVGKYDNDYRTFELGKLTEMLKTVKVEKFTENVLAGGKSTEAQKAKIAELRKKVTFNKDVVNPDLSLTEIAALLASRVIKAVTKKK